jgi:hypothetical protein
MLMTKLRGTVVEEAVSAMTSFVIDGIEPSGCVTRELFGEVYNGAMGAEDGRCMHPAQGRV